MVSYNIQMIEDREPVDDAYDHDDLRSRYAAAKAASTGSEIVCPMCSYKFTKKNQAQAFCSHGKKKRKGRNCKDEYHNITNPRGTQDWIKRSNATDKYFADIDEFFEVDGS